MNEINKYHVETGTVCKNCVHCWKLMEGMTFCDRNRKSFSDGKHDVLTEEDNFCKYFERKA